jgi:cation diffusion facilitator CzcD-associated flavoprotein CzcO
LYTYSWEKKPDWSRFYAERDEIFTYYKSLADEWGVAKSTRFNAKVIKAVWDPKFYRYDLEIEDVQTGEKMTDNAEVLINATGWLKCLPLRSSKANSKFLEMARYPWS